MRVLVTGARGFVGTRLCSHLSAHGAEVTAVDREIEITDPAAVASVVASTRPEAVVHLAAHSSVAGSFEAPAACFRVNFLGTRAVLEALRCHAPRARLLLVSSGAVYGTSERDAPPQQESAPLRPESPYAWTKAAADRLAGAWAERGLDVVRARPFNHTGPGRPESFVEASFARQLVLRETRRAGGPLTVGNLDAVRDFLDVDDVIEAYRRLLDPAVPAGVYNVASGVGRTIRELLDGLVAASSLDAVEVEVDPARWRPTEVSCGSAKRLHAATGWEPRIPFEETLRRLVEDWRQRCAAA